MPSHTIAVLPGDGIGPEVTAAALPAIEDAARRHGAELRFDHLPYGADHYLATGDTLPEPALERLRTECDAILVGAFGDPRVPDHAHAKDILLGLRFRLDLYINFRPIRLLHPRLTPLRTAPTIDFAIFRENTEGQYLGRGRTSGLGTPDEAYVAEELGTRTGIRRITEAAFRWARAHRRPRVTLCDKSNAIPFQALWGDVFQEVAAGYSDIEPEHRYADILAMELVRDPSRFHVIVTNNLYGDILSDLGAGLVGGLGLAPSANLHPGRPGLFEPVHGSAPTLAGSGRANPMAMHLTGALMLGALGYPKAQAALEQAVQAVIADGPTTPDLDGSGSTSVVATAVRDALA